MLRIKHILIVAPYNSSWITPLKNAFNNLEFKVSLFDYRNILGNFRFNPLLYIPLIATTKIKEISNNHSSRAQILNKILVNACKFLKPDYVFVIKGESISKSAVEQIKQLGIKTILWQIDPIAHPSIWSYTKVVGKSYDVYVSCEPGKVIEKLKRNGFKNVLYMLGAADGGKMIHSQSLHKTYDISFVGTYDAVREKFLAALEGLDVHIWGWGDWHKSKVSKMFEGSALTQEKMLTVYAKSKIVINVNRAKNSTIPTNLRPFEAAQVGAFILVDHKINLSEVFKIGKEIDTFKSPQELRQKITYYLTHSKKRKSIAQAMQIRVKRDHTYDKRLNKLFSEIDLITT